jgi:hypothetical protein
VSFWGKSFSTRSLYNIDNNDVICYVPAGKIYFTSKASALRYMYTYGSLAINGFLHSFCTASSK